VWVQLVAGYLHYFTIEVKDGGAKKPYESRAIWTKITQSSNKFKK
jgi:hypothetical protein